jgi:hypothetical protein
LGLFYAISAYHTSNNKEFNATRATIDAIQNQELPRLYHGAVEDLLPLKELNLEDGKTAKNVFYLIGGTKIIPVSEIITIFIKILDELTGSSSSRSNKILNTTLEYNGPTI